MPTANHGGNSARAERLERARVAAAVGERLVKIQRSAPWASIGQARRQAELEIAREVRRNK